MSPDFGGRWLVLLPHPDDELVMIGLLRRIAREGELHVAWAHSTPVREAESRLAFEIAGIETGSMHFAQFPDGDFVDHLPALADWVRERMLVGPANILTLAWEQGHLDHDSLHWACRRQAEAPVWEVPIYHPFRHPWMQIQRFPDGDGGVCVPLLPEESRLKYDLTYAFPSQRVGRYLRLRARLAGGKPDFLRFERLRRAPEYDYSRPQSRADRTREWRRWLRALQVPSTHVSPPDGALRPDAGPRRP